MLGVAIGATPILGAVTLAQDLPPAPVLAQAEIDPLERQMFEQAAQSGDPARINAFLRAYPDSPLVRSLLVNLPPETLQFIERSALSLVGPAVVRSLPIALRQSLGLPAPSGFGTPGSSGSESVTTDTYAG